MDKKNNPIREVCNIPIAKNLHAAIKQYASDQGMTISGLTTRALIEYFDSRGKFFCPESYTVQDRCNQDKAKGDEQ